MTDELTKTFFKTFDIQYEFCLDSFLNPCKFQCDDCEFNTERYPEITDHILLALICIAHTSPVITFTSRDIKNLKKRSFVSFM